MSCIIEVREIMISWRQLHRLFIRWNRQSKHIATQNELAEVVAKADALRDKKRYGDAARAYKEAVSIDPGRHDLHVQLGNMLKDSSAFEAAIESYRCAAGLDPANSDTYLQWGRAYILNDQIDAAQGVLRQALTADPHNHEAAHELQRITPLSQPLNLWSSRLRSALIEQSGSLISGWAFDPLNPREPVVIDVEIDGFHYMRVRAVLIWSDLLRIAPDIVGGGFEFTLPYGNREVEVAVVHEGRHLIGSPYRAHLTGKDTNAAAYASHRATLNKEVAVIIPIYGADDVNEYCLRALLRYTPARAHLIFVFWGDNDDPVSEISNKIQGLAELFPISPTFSSTSEDNSFAAAVNIGILQAATADVLLLTPHIMVGPRWFSSIQAAAYSAPDVATATAFSDDLGLSSDLQAAAGLNRPPWLDLASYQRLVRRASARHWPEVSTGSLPCLYIRRQAIDEVGLFDTIAFPGCCVEQDWCMRAGALGWRHIFDDATLVSNTRGTSFSGGAFLDNARNTLNERYPDYDVLTQRRQASAGISDALRRVRRLNSQIPSGRTIPRVLFVISTETGGTPLTNRDLMGALSQEVEPWVLQCNSRRMVLSRFCGATLTEVAVHYLPEPLSLTPHRSSSYDERIWLWLLEYAFEIIHIRHIAWHSISLPKIAASLDITVIMSFHDFYTVCPNVKLLDNDLVYCGGNCTSSLQDCRSDELWRAESYPPLKHHFVHEWRRRLLPSLAACEAFITTTVGARDVILSNYPELMSKRFDVIPHGRDFKAFVQPRTASTPLCKLKILVPGNISPAKGRNLILEIAALDGGARLEFHVLGRMDPIFEGVGITNHGAYERETFVERASAIRADIGIILSIWPETWCHTLTEMWAAGLPVAVLTLGAPAERVRASKAGWVLRNHDPVSILNFLHDIANSHDEICRVSKNVKLWQETQGAQETTCHMAEQYLRLYRNIAPSAFL